MAHDYSGFVKVRFSSKKHGATAGLVMPTITYVELSVSELSRKWPYSEALKMETVEASKPYDTWEQAFAHEFG